MYSMHALFIVSLHFYLVQWEQKKNGAIIVVIFLSPALSLVLIAFSMFILPGRGPMMFMFIQVEFTRSWLWLINFYAFKKNTE